MSDTNHGRSINDICEAEAGGLLGRALALSDLHSAAYGVAEELAYDEEPEAKRIVELCRAVERLTSDLSLAEDGTLTSLRECARCSGDGKTTGEDPCIECGGTGSVHMEEATQNLASPMDKWVARCSAEHAASVVRGEHDDECEYGSRRRGSILMLCNCSKRRREAEGFTTPPTDDLYFPPPDCPRCDGDLDLDGDIWHCYDCALSWDIRGDGGSCEFTDDFGDLSDTKEGATDA